MTNQLHKDTENDNNDNKNIEICLPYIHFDDPGLIDPIYVIQYDIHITDYDRRLHVWRQLTTDIINDYQKLITELEQSLKQNKKMKAGDHYSKILSTTHTRNRIYTDFLRLIKGNHDKYQEFRKIYVNFLQKMDRIEEDFIQITQKAQQNAVS